SDGTVALWDCTRGRERHVFRGHTAAAEAVALSPDGCRAFSSDSHGNIKVWDAESGQEVCSLQVPGIAYHLALSPEGHWLLAGLNGGDVQVLDARPLTDTVRAEREAHGLVELYLSRPMLKGEARGRIRTLESISEPVRLAALLLLEQYHDDPRRFNTASWALLRWPGLPLVQYQQALRNAEIGYLMEP